MKFLTCRRRHHHTDEAEDIETAIGVWTLIHGTDKHDMSAEQRERRRLYVRCTNQGLDPSRVAFAVFLAKNGRLSDG